jgi:MYXO-CTERM domain-containing protein
VLGQANAQHALAPSCVPIAAPGTTKDLAPIKDGRLKKTDSAQTNEQATVTLLSDGIHGLYVHMRSGPINDALPPHRTQLACFPFKLVSGANGAVTADKLPGEKFVTDNDGDEYRNGHKPSVLPVCGGKAVLLTYNYQEKGAGNTRRYAKVLDSECNAITIKNGKGETKKQVVIMAKNNDDCDMSQSGQGPCDICGDTPTSTHYSCWAGCNGNGEDDGWVNDITVSCQLDANGKVTAAQVEKNFDVSMASAEERSRGRSSCSTADPATAIATWTEGNNQPQRDGTWIGAVNISAVGPKGDKQQSRVLWKKLVQGQKNAPGGGKTYSSRINSAVIPVLGANGALEKSNQFVLYVGDLKGANTNNRKGGRYLDQLLCVASATKGGLTYDIPCTSVQDLMVGIDATHLTIAATLMWDGKLGKNVPVVLFFQGSQNGGGVSAADIKVLGIDLEGKKFVQYGTYSAGCSHDRHLYSNYLGNNPGNQGRNFAGVHVVKNPFAAPGQAPTLVLFAATGKDPAHVAKAEIKPTAYLSVIPMAVGGPGPTAAAAEPAAAPVVDAAPATTESASASDGEGCSAASGSTSSSAALLLGLMALAAVWFARRGRA